MPEYFDISLIVDKNKKQTLQEYLLREFGLDIGENDIKDSKYTILSNKKVILSTYKDSNEADFEEFCIGIPDYVFRKITFEEQLKQFTDFVTACFNNCKSIQFALCSYEINGYLIGNKTKLTEFTAEFLKNFPIVYSRKPHLSKPAMTLNLDAQDIFP